MEPVDPEVLEVFERSLERCGRDRTFLDRFYERFLASSPKVEEKFAETDFEHQKRALRASFHVLLLAAEDPESPGAREYLEHLAQRHSASEMDIGAELYDLWLDSLLETVRESDPEFDSGIEEAWEDVMGVGIRFLVSRYRSIPEGGSLENDHSYQEERR
ncbi:MAG: globin [Thermoanaerobaculia bacterium]|nr:globin [Thermoanaerobaculia bacterium]